jgi:hypothetical protein
MKKVVCVVDNRIHLEYGKIYEIMGTKRLTFKKGGEEGPTSIRVLGLDGWWDKKLFVSLEEFRNKQIDKILECTTSFA